LVAVVSVLMLSGGYAYAQSETPCPVPIANLMSAEEFERAGLRALTPEQLDVLSSWVDADRKRIAREVDDNVKAPEQAIESRIDGDFDGWVGDTVFKLQNGQVWQQASPSAHYMFIKAPRVVISSAPYRMKVEGIAAEIAVRRLR
jgi:hypothetical protein